MALKQQAHQHGQGLSVVISKVHIHGKIGFVDITFSASQVNQCQSKAELDMHFLHIWLFMTYHLSDKSLF